MSSPLTYERACQLLAYEADTGVLRWRGKVGKRDRTGQVVGTSSTKGHLRAQVDGRQHYVHRLAWLLHFGFDPATGMVVDHINGNPTDNRISNLRLATYAENVQNTRKVNKQSVSGLLGVRWDEECGTWRARIGVDKKRKWLGSYADKHLAHAAYMAAKRVYHPGFVG